MYQKFCPLNVNALLNDPDPLLSFQFYPQISYTTKLLAHFLQYAGILTSFRKHPLSVSVHTHNTSSFMRKIIQQAEYLCQQARLIQILKNFYHII